MSKKLKLAVRELSAAEVAGVAGAATVTPAPATGDEGWCGTRRPGPRPPLGNV